jgi:serine/threonine protein phosphatase PrpC
LANQQLKRGQDYWCAQIQGTRDNQEDDTGFVDNHPDQLLMLLADGMGGYLGGSLASQKALEVFATSFDFESNDTLSNRLINSLKQANSALASIKGEKPELQEMGCTVVGALLSLESFHLHWISIGDSPLWTFRKGALIRLNADHSKRAELDEQVKNGKLSAEEADKNPHRNVLTAALTGDPPSLLDNHSSKVENGDILLLASDGLFSLTNKEIEQRINTDITLPAKNIVNNLLTAVKNKSKCNQDNTSVLIVKIPRNYKP